MKNSEKKRKMRKNGSEFENIHTGKKKGGKHFSERMRSDTGAILFETCS